MDKSLLRPFDDSKLVRKRPRQSDTADEAVEGERRVRGGATAGLVESGSVENSQESVEEVRDKGKGRLV